MSRYRIKVPIYGLTSAAAVAAQDDAVPQCTLHPDAQTRRPRCRPEAQAEDLLVAQKRRAASPGDTYAITCGEPMGHPGGTNMLKVCQVL
jgi:pyruvate kinase